jgi:hypothetical protein
VLLQYDDYINGNTIATDEETGEAAVVAEEYKGIIAHFNKYIVDTPEEISEVLARKVTANLMSIFAAVREQHPDWDDQAIYKEANIIYAEKAGVPIQVADPSKPTEQSTVLDPKDFEEEDEGNGDEPPEDDEGKQKQE